MSDWVRTGLTGWWNVCYCQAVLGQVWLGSGTCPNARMYCDMFDSIMEHVLMSDCIGT